MYEGSSFSELMENGTAIQSIERSMQYLDEAIDSIVEKMTMTMGISEMMLNHQLVLLKEQKAILCQKYQELLKRRKMLTRSIQENALRDFQASDEIDIIDRIVMKLLAIDDIYAETHKTSNSSIMSFVEELLTKKKELL